MSLPGVIPAGIPASWHPGSVVSLHFSRWHPCLVSSLVGGIPTRGHPCLASSLPSDTRTRLHFCSMSSVTGGIPARCQCLPYPVAFLSGGIPARCHPYLGTSLRARCRCHPCRVAFLPGGIPGRCHAYLVAWHPGSVSSLPVCILCLCGLLALACLGPDGNKERPLENVFALGDCAGM